MKALNVIETAYRATLEEQDDTIVWLTHAMKGAGAELDVLLRGSAVNYAAKDQDASGLAFGERRQKHSPHIAEDVAALIRKGVNVFIVREDLMDRGLRQGDLIDELKPVGRAELPQLFGNYDYVWHW